ncbi:unnamed protein product [Tilletia caries]|nr:unnamed protein product [Tilletia caries]
MAGSVEVALNALLDGGGSTSDGSDSAASSSAAAAAAAVATLTAAGPQLILITTSSQQNELAAITLARLSNTSNTQHRHPQCTPELELLRNLSRVPNTRLTHPDALITLITYIQHSIQIHTTPTTTTATATTSDNAVDQDADMAMRTLNNILMLHPTTRDKFSSNITLTTSTTTVHGAQATAQLLSTIAPTANQYPTLVFLAARLLFFSTLFENPFVVQAVEDEGILESYLKSVRSLSAGENYSPEAMPALTELLKLAFNLSLYYPRLRPDRAERWNEEQQARSAASSAKGSSWSSSSSKDTSSSASAPTAGDAWTQELSGLVQPTTELFQSLTSAPALINRLRPPLEPPIQQTVALLLNIPTPLALSHSLTHSLPLSPNSTKQAQAELDILTKLYDLLALALHRYFPHPTKPLSSPTPSILSSSSSSTRKSVRSRATTVTVGDEGQQRAYATDDLMMLALNSYFPDRPVVVLPPPPESLADGLRYGVEDPDTPGMLAGARTQAVKDGMGGNGGGDPEIGLEPLILLARKYVAEDQGGLAGAGAGAGDGGAGGKWGKGAAAKQRRTALQTFRMRLLPDDLDRTIPPHKQPTLAGILIRLMSSVMFPRVARAASELLLAVCNGDPQELSRTIGYGPAAGFLALMGAGVVANSGSLPLASNRSSMSNGSSSTIGTGTDNYNSGLSTDSNAAPPRPIDPITGRFADVTDTDELPSSSLSSPTSPSFPRAPQKEMTPEEREREAERLFVLFERLNKTGVGARAVGDAAAMEVIAWRTAAQCSLINEGASARGTKGGLRMARWARTRVGSVFMFWAELSWKCKDRQPYS